MKFKSSLTFGILAAYVFSAVNAQIPGMNSECKPKSSYHFQGKVTAEMQIKSDKTGTSITHSKIYFSDSGKLILMFFDIEASRSGMEMKSIINMRDSTIVSLMDMKGNKIGSCNSMKNGMNNISPKGFSDKFPSWSEFEKTGETKEILSYTCEEYYCEKDGRTYSIWLSNQVKDSELLKNGWRLASGGIAQLPSEMTLTCLAYSMSDAPAGTAVSMEITAVCAACEKDIDTTAYKFN